MDSQTLLGKLPSVVSSRSGTRPVHLVVGRNTLDPAAPTPFASIRAIGDLTAADTSADPELTAQLLTAIAPRIAMIHEAGVLLDRRMEVTRARRASRPQR